MENSPREEKMKPVEVTHEKHYRSSCGIEAYDAIAAATENMKGIDAFDTGNVIKYAFRWDKKGTPITDVKKIIDYATRILNRLQHEASGYQD